MQRLHDGAAERVAGLVLGVGRLGHDVAAERVAGLVSLAGALGCVDAGGRHVCWWFEVVVESEVCGFVGVTVSVECGG